MLMSVMKHEERVRRFVDEIWAWYARHKRELPWRDLPIPDDTERAYRVYVSEVMLQQTQVPRVKIVYRQFLELFPSLPALAAASNKDVILAWRGMGYNSRALRMRDAARHILEERGGVFPREMEDLLSINGIGAYTAAAVRNFAFGLPTPCIDTNIRRILHRTFVGPESADGTWGTPDDDLLVLAGEVLEEAIRRHAQLASASPAAADWHAALMDFGSLVQTKRSPRWDVCPLTAAGIMKTTLANFPVMDGRRHAKRPQTEPGRMISGRFVPNRIVRGRIVEALRDAPEPLQEDTIGREVATDWDGKVHIEWLEGVLAGLIRDGIIVRRERGYALD